VVAVSPHEQLAARLRSSEKNLVRVARPDGALGDRLRALPGVLHVTSGPALGELVVEAALGKDAREDIARTVVGAGAGLLELRPLAMSLEDVFLRLVTHEDATGEAEAASPGTAPAGGPPSTGDGRAKEGRRG
jgi:ABC-2 type transport system ATP-binding protein